MNQVHIMPIMFHVKHITKLNIIWIRKKNYQKTLQTSRTTRTLRLLQHLLKTCQLATFTMALTMMKIVTFSAWSTLVSTYATLDVGSPATCH